MRNTPRTVRPNSANWNGRALLISLGTALLFVGTWLLPLTRPAWDTLDISVFRMLNGLLSLGTGWQKFWAVCNWRGFDLVSGAAAGILLLYAIRDRESQRTYSGWASIGMLAASIFIGRAILGNWLIEEVYEYQRISPTGVLDSTWRLSELVPQIDAKDFSPFSFPGDHGFVLLTIALYLCYWAGPSACCTAWIFAIVFALPRLVSGAHWFTDISIGSAGMALVTSSVLMATPLHNVFVDAICRIMGQSQVEQIGNDEPAPGHATTGKTKTATAETVADDCAQAA